MNNLKHNLKLISLTILVILISFFIIGILYSNQISEITKSISPRTQLAQVDSLNDGLVAHYTFDDGTATDSSGNNNNGTLQNGPTPVAGNVGSGALSFDGGDDYVKSSNSSTYTDASFSAWVFPKSTAIGGVISSGSGILRNVAVQGSNFQVHDGNWHYVAGVTINSWHQIALTFTGSTKELRMYVDGVQKYNGVGTNFSNASFNTIGAFENGTSWRFNGFLDDVRVYNRALSDIEISDLYNYTSSSVSPPPPTPINGSCSVIVNSCAIGSLSDTTDSSTEYLWSCTGSDGGSTASCSLPIPPVNDATSPTIQNIQTTSITPTSATVTYTTDESSDTQIEYGLTISYSSQTILNTQLITSHSQTLSGLTPNTTYHYRVNSKDAVGNHTESTDQIFTTQALSSSEVTALSCSMTDVQNAINLVTSGGTVNVPAGGYAGDCVWSSAITINKPISIIGAGSGTSGTKLTTSSSMPNGFFNITGFTASTLVRISGFAFQMTNRTPYTAINVHDMMGGVNGGQIRIDNNVFYFGNSPVTFYHPKGLVDHNYFYNGIQSISFSSGSRTNADASWASLSAGTSDALFIEDNHFITDVNYALTYTQEQIGTFNGGKLVVRNNDFNATTVSGTLGTYTPFMAHGSADGGCGGAGYWEVSACQRRGQSVIEFYNNTESGKRIDFMYISRGSVNLVYNNVITGTVSNNPRIMLVEEEYSSDNWSVHRIAWPAEDQIHNTFIWNNTYRGHDFNDGVYGSVETSPTNYNCTANATPMSCCAGRGIGTCGNNATPTSNPFIRKDRDYFLHAPEATGGREIFVCASGISDCNGASNTYPTDGVKYPTLGTMVFSPEGSNAYYPYIPYTYPHPLVSGSPNPPPLSTPSPTPNTYTPETIQAVQAFQKANNIISSGTPDTTGYGIVGPKTKQVINSIINNKYSENTTNTTISKRKPQPFIPISTSTPEQSDTTTPTISWFTILKEIIHSIYTNILKGAQKTWEQIKGIL